MAKKSNQNSKKIYFALPEQISDFTDEQIEEFASSVMAQLLANRKEENDQND